MKRYSVIFVLFCLGVLIASGMFLAAAAKTLPDQVSAEDFVGVWKVLHMETPQGLATRQHGLMMVYANYVCHLHVNKEREGPTREDSEEVRLEKRARLWGHTTASCGTFELQENTFTVNWTISNNPGTEGHVTDFVLARDGDQIKVAPAANPEFKVVYEKLK